MGEPTRPRYARKHGTGRSSHHDRLCFLGRALNSLGRPERCVRPARRPEAARAGSVMVVSAPAKYTWQMLANKRAHVSEFGGNAAASGGILPLRFLAPIGPGGPGGAAALTRPARPRARQRSGPSGRQRSGEAQASRGSSSRLTAAGAAVQAAESNAEPGAQASHEMGMRYEAALAMKRWRLHRRVPLRCLPDCLNGSARSRKGMYAASECVPRAPNLKLEPKLKTKSSNLISLQISTEKCPKSENPRGALAAEWDPGPGQRPPQRQRTSAA